MMCDDRIETGFLDDIPAWDRVEAVREEASRGYGVVVQDLCLLTCVLHKIAKGNDRRKFKRDDARRKGGM